MIRTVVFLETSARIGGTETVLSRLMRGIRRDRFRPILCCLYEPGLIGSQLIKEGYPVIHSLGAGSWDLRVPLRLARFLLRERPSVLFIVNQPLTQWWGTWCGLLARIPVKITAIRSTGKINRIGRRLWINRVTFPWISRVTALSGMHKRYLVEQEGIPSEKIEIVPNGVDLERFRGAGDPGSLRKELGIPASARVVGIVAMLRPEKNHPLFLRSAAEVKRKVPEAFFLVVGEGPERRRLESLAAELGLRDSVLFLGVRQDIPALLALLSVAVLSSHPVVETLSNAVLEYMAAGLPVVATRVGSVPEQVADGETGFLVEPDDAPAMAARIIELLRDDSLRERMGKAGWARVKERYTIDRMIRETESLFDRLLAEAERGR